jgi:hypothetical protein
VIKVCVGGTGELQGPVAYVVESLIVDAEARVREVEQLLQGEEHVIRPDDRILYLGRGHNRVRVDDPVWILVAYLREQERTHAGAGATTQGMRQLEALKTVAILGLVAQHVLDFVDELRALGVVPLGPIIAGPTLPEDKVVRPKYISVFTRPYGVNGPGLEIDDYRTWYETLEHRLVEEDVYFVQLYAVCAIVLTVRPDAMFLRYYLPELEGIFCFFFYFNR